MENSDMERRQDTYKLAGEYSRWGISTLLLLNSGAIAGIFKSEGLNQKWKLALIAFSLGIGFALLSGFLSWFNLYYKHGMQNACWAIGTAVMSAIALFIGAILVLAIV